MQNAPVLVSVMMTPVGAEVTAVRQNLVKIMCITAILSFNSSHDSHFSVR